jgi:outer membrane protein assembly factor BamB
MTIQTLRLPIALVLTAAALAGLGGCSSTVDTGPQAPADIDARRSGFPINDEDFARIGYRRDWLGFPVVTTGGRITHVHIGQDAIGVMESGSTATVLEASTGERRWSNQLANKLTRFVSMSRVDGQLLACAEAEVIGLRVDSGDIIARQGYSRVVNTEPVLVGKSAIFGTASGHVISHGLGLGFQDWAFTTGVSVSRDPVMVAGSVGVVNDRGEAFFLDPLNGSIVGRSRAMYDGSAFNPVAAGDLMVVASRDQSLYAFRPNSERPVWQYRSSVRPASQPSYANGVVYCEIEGNLMAFDAPTGAVKWKSEGTIGSVVALSQGRLVVRQGNALTLVDAGSGDVLETISVPGMFEVVTASKNPAEGNLYIVSTGGLLAKFIPR